MKKESLNFINRIFSADLSGQLNSGKITISNPDRGLDGLIVSGISKLYPGNILWIVDENSITDSLRAELSLWLDLTGDEREIVLLPLPSRDPYFNDEVTGVYNEEIFKLFNGVISNRKLIVIASPLSVKVNPGSIQDVKKSIMKVKKSMEINRDKLLSELVEFGYSHENWIETPGEFKKRGGIVEVFPAANSNPVRIEFFGNRIESLTLFHPGSRYSLKEVEEITIPSCRVFGPKIRFSDLMERKKGENIYRILSNPRIVCSDIQRSVSISEKYINNFKKILEMNRDNTSLPEPEVLFSEIGEIPACMDIRGAFDETQDSFELRKVKNIREFTTGDLQNLKDVSRKGKKVFIFSPVSSLSDNLRDGGVWFQGFEKIIPFSFENIKLNTLFLTTKEYRYHPAEELFGDDISGEQVIGSLEEGDYVVHSLHGVGKFKGTTLLKIGKIEQEFIQLEYSGGERLYVPVYEANTLNKYSSLKGVPASLDKIGGKSWKNKKNRAKKSILLFAKELLDLYARRKAIKGFSYPEGSEIEQRLSDGFEYNETPDQKKAIKDVMRDLEKGYPMERLICGDVSFGKTEVAIRGALRVVVNGKQVAVLCPTTILAMQHYRTFLRRLKDLPVRVEMISRMVPKSKENEIIKDVKAGKVDILIGTHSLLSERVEFKDLGMYIIDEEQRFGVFQKEKLKKGRENIDVLSLSATPIPRTLSMSMAGLQDISVIRTPPQGRLAVKNYIGPFYKEKVISAVLNEIDRGGAVFIVYNSIEKIFSFKSVLEKWLPDISITVIHAKMKTSEIEKNLSGFIEGKDSVLLSTTIIENGIDISHVNTLIVIEADNYGLTQLYQLRGRIGRSSRQGYAYFFTKGVTVTDKAKMRLEGIRDHSSIGSGFKLAELDLKLRGAGSLLGNRQHGHIEALGFDYYNDLLKQTIDELKGIERKEWTGKINVNFGYSLDKNIVENMSDRMEIYKNISSASSLEDLDRYREELDSIYGGCGKTFERLFFVGKSKFIAAKYMCKSVRLEISKVDYEFGEDKIPLLRFSEYFFEKYKPAFRGAGIVSFTFSDHNVFFNDLLEELDRGFKIP